MDRIGVWLAVVVAACGAALMIGATVWVLGVMFS